MAHGVMCKYPSYRPCGTPGELLNHTLAGLAPALPHLLSWHTH